MAKIKGKVTETIIVVKEVEFEVPDEEFDEMNVDQLVRDKAYEATIFEGAEEINGWEIAGCEGVEVESTVEEAETPEE